MPGRQSEKIASLWTPNIKRVTDIDKLKLYIEWRIWYQHSHLIPIAYVSYSKRKKVTKRRKMKKRHETRDCMVSNLSFFLIPSSGFFHSWFMDGWMDGMTELVYELLFSDTWTCQRPQFSSCWISISPLAVFHSSTLTWHLKLLSKPSRARWWWECRM